MPLIPSAINVRRWIKASRVVPRSLVRPEAVTVAHHQMPLRVTSFMRLCVD